MSKAVEFEAVFERLRQILARHAPHLVVKADEPGHVYLDTAHIMKNKQPMFFGAAKIQKQYVSFYLMPVYVFPDLLREISPELQKRMQGKSCFNFRQVEEPLFDELARLAEAGFRRYEAEGLLR